MTPSEGEIKRYDLKEDHHGAWMDEVKNGQYVAWEDHEAALQERDKRIAELEKYCGDVLDGQKEWYDRWVEVDKIKDEIGRKYIDLEIKSNKQIAALTKQLNSVNWALDESSQEGIAVYLRAVCKERAELEAKLKEAEERVDLLEKIGLEYSGTKVPKLQLELKAERERSGRLVKILKKAAIMECDKYYSDCETANDKDLCGSCAAKAALDETKPSTQEDSK